MGGSEDSYAAEIREKVDRKMLVGNMLESRQQAKISKMGGAMSADDS